jgi:hypothetical protein
MSAKAIPGNKPLRAIVGQEFPVTAIRIYEKIIKLFSISAPFQHVLLL